MEDMESDLAIFCSQARLSVVGTLWLEKVLCRLQKKKTWTPTQLPNLSTYNLFWLQMCWGPGGMELVRVTNQWLVWFEAHDTRESLWPILPGSPETRDWTIQRPRPVHWVVIIRERLPLAADGSGCRHPKPDIVQRENINSSSPFSPSPWRSGNPMEDREDGL